MGRTLVGHVVRAGLLLALVGCGKDPGADSTTTSSTPTGTETTSPTGTDTSTTVPGLASECRATANGLRFDCQVQVQPAGPVEVFFAPTAGGEEHSFRSSEVVEDHLVTLSMMKPETEYTWRVVDGAGREVRGSFVTGLPDPGCGVVADFSGTTSASYVVTQSPCLDGMRVVVVDRDGDIVWCDALEDGRQRQLEGFNITEDDTFLGVGADLVMERNLAGQQVLRLERQVDFRPHVHHDAFRKDGLTYVLFNEFVDSGGIDWILDGFLVFDGPTRVAEWHMADWITVPTSLTQSDFGTDYSHANGIWVDDAGQVLMTFRHLSAVLAVQGTPGAPDFGQIDWVLSAPASPIASDFTWSTAVSGPADFRMQHNAHFLPTGELAVFDNRCMAGIDGCPSPQADSRLLHIDLDTAAGAAEIIDSFPVPTFCPFQGGALHTAVGNPVATCAPNSGSDLPRAWEYDRNSGTQVWTMRVACPGGPSSYITRVAPWEGPW